MRNLAVKVAAVLIVALAGLAQSQAVAVDLPEVWNGMIIGMAPDTTNQVIWYTGAAQGTIHHVENALTDVIHMTQGVMKVPFHAGAGAFGPQPLFIDASQGLALGLIPTWGAQNTFCINGTTDHWFELVMAWYWLYSQVPGGWNKIPNGGRTLAFSGPNAQMGLSFNGVNLSGVTAFDNTVVGPAQLDQVSNVTGSVLYRTRVACMAMKNGTPTPEFFMDSEPQTGFLIHTIPRQMGG